MPILFKVPALVGHASHLQLKRAQTILVRIIYFIADKTRHLPFMIIGPLVCYLSIIDDFIDLAADTLYIPSISACFGIQRFYVNQIFAI